MECLGDLSCSLLLKDDISTTFVSYHPVLLAVLSEHPHPLPDPPPVAKGSAPLTQAVHA